MIIFNQLGKKGRLGNQLFQIAATLARARNMDVLPIFNYWLYKKYFEKEIDDSFDKPEAPEGYHIYQEVQTVGVKPISWEPFMELRGHFQSEKYFKDERDYVLSYFQPKSELYKLVRSAGEQWLSLSNITAIHVRRKDYLNLEHLFPQLSKIYYKAAIDRVESITQTPENTGNYLIFSDDIPWCKATFGTSFNYSTGNQDIVDLFLMAMCKHHIIANSSFSWWGAYLKRLFMTEQELKKSITIAPATWFNPESKLVDKDIYCEGWIKI